MPEVSDTVCYAAKPGRHLRRSPPWPCSDNVVVFDAASGDHWVISHDGWLLLSSVHEVGPLPSAALAERVQPAVAPDRAAMILDDLARNGLVDEVVDTAPGLLAVTASPL